MATGVLKSHAPAFLSFQSSWEGETHLKIKMKGTDRKYCGNSEKGVNRPTWDNLGKPPTGHGWSWGSTDCPQVESKGEKQRHEYQARPRPRPFKRKVDRWPSTYGGFFSGQYNVLNSQVNIDSK